MLYSCIYIRRKEVIIIRTKDLLNGAILTSLALLIPLAFGGFLGITLPPFSATLAAHVPVMIAMTLSPFTAFMVAFGSALGFLVKLGPIIGLRAGMHIIFASIGAILYKRGFSFVKILVVTLPIHALSEALIVLPFGFSLYKAGVLIGVGTMLHHSLDSIIAVSLAVLLVRANILNIKIK